MVPRDGEEWRAPVGADCGGEGVSSGSVEAMPTRTSRSPVDIRRGNALVWGVVGRRLLIVCSVLVGLLGGPGLAQDFLPEPDITYFGSVPPGSQVAISHPAGLLDSVSAGSGSYVLVARLVQPVADPAPANPPAGSALAGDSATLLINGIAQGRVPLAERGAVYRLDVPNPVTAPNPDAVLNPTRVVPAIPGASPTPTPDGTTTPPTTTPTIGGVDTPTPTFTPTPETSGCVGDCNGNGQVAINELVQGVNIALGRAPIDQCLSFDRNMDDNVAINELIAAVNNALKGCAGEL